jgi:hypothetical protein
MIKYIGTSGAKEKANRCVKSKISVIWEGENSCSEGGDGLKNTDTLGPYYRPLLFS